MTLEYGEPCFKCGVRPDVDCKHRKAPEPLRNPQDEMKVRAARYTALNWKLSQGYQLTKRENENG